MSPGCYASFPGSLNVRRDSANHGGRQMLYRLPYCKHGAFALASHRLRGAFGRWLNYPASIMAKVNAPKARYTNVCLFCLFFLNSAPIEMRPPLPRIETASSCSAPQRHIATAPARRVISYIALSGSSHRLQFALLSRETTPFRI